MFFERSDGRVWELLEKKIEQKLVREVKKKGGIAPKWVSPGFAGIPEVKAPGEVPRPLQKARHRLLKKLGFKVYVLDDEKDIPEILKEVEEL